MRFSPAAERSKQPLLDALTEVLPARGLVLEVASGTGQHVVHFAAALPGLTWQPSERTAEACAAIADRIAASGAANVRAPVALDVTAARWPCDRADAVVALGLLHVAGPEVRDGLLAGAARVLPAGAPLAIYGPFRAPGGPAPASAPAHLAGWTVPAHALVPPVLDELVAAAAGAGFVLDHARTVVADDHRLVVLTKAAAPGGPGPRR